MSRLASLGRIVRLHPVASAAFGLAACFVLLFTVRLVLITVHFADPANRRSEPQPWMTPRYVAMSWQLPPDAVAAALKVPPDAPRRPTIEGIARLRGVPVAQVIAELEAYLATQGRAE